MNLLLVITVITVLLLVISLVSDVREGLGIAHISVALLLSVALLVGIWIMDGLSKSQDAAPMVRGTPVAFSMALPGELPRPLATKNSLLTLSPQRAGPHSEALVTGALERLAAATGTSRADRELIVHTHKGN